MPNRSQVENKAKTYKREFRLRRKETAVKISCTLEVCPPKKDNRMTADLDLKLVEIYCAVDDFLLQHFTPSTLQAQLPPPATPGKATRKRKTSLSLSEQITIVVFFQLSGYKDFKHYYCNHILSERKQDFPTAVSYSRFIRLLPRVLFLLLAFLLFTRMGRCTGVSFIDSTVLRVCHTRRILSHRVFAGVAKTGKTTMGWFYGFKLHLIVNTSGELLSFALTAGNVADNSKALVSKLVGTTKLWGRLFGDKGYISTKLQELLRERNIQLITSLRGNMKNKLLPLEDKLLLRKRSLIESINDELKNNCEVEHSRHRSTQNFLVHLFAALTAYTFLPKKPSLKFENQLLPLAA